LLEISDFHSNLYGDRHILHYGNDIVYPYWEDVTSCQQLTTKEPPCS